VHITHCESKRNGDDTSTLTLPLIEHLVKAFKTHRAAIDFDAGFVDDVFVAIVCSGDRCFLCVIILQLNF
jgi:hypothetical protein